MGSNEKDDPSHTSTHFSASALCPGILLSLWADEEPPLPEETAHLGDKKDVYLEKPGENTTKQSEDEGEECDEESGDEEELGTKHFAEIMCTILWPVSITMILVIVCIRGLNMSSTTTAGCASKLVNAYC